MSAELATVSFRTESGVAEDKPWTVVDSAVLSSTVPWRKFRWYKGQRHYSGVYWSATMRDHVVYESRLELSRLIFADFDQAVERILALPFLLSRASRRHRPGSTGQPGGNDRFHPREPPRSRTVRLTRPSSRRLVTTRRNDR
jgi:hypothetical protein